MNNSQWIVHSYASVYDRLRDHVHSYSLWLCNNSGVHLIPLIEWVEKCALAYDAFETNQNTVVCVHALISDDDYAMGILMFGEKFTRLVADRTFRDVADQDRSWRWGF